MKIFYHCILALCLPLFSFGQQTINGTIIHNDLQRDYILFVPEIYNPDMATPLVLNFHGYTSSAIEQMWYGDFRTIADTAGFLVVHPMGTLDDLGNAHWNVGWGTSTVDDVGFTEALIDSLALEYNIDMERVFSTGMSNGGFMSYTLACQLSHRIAAIASVTGTMNVGAAADCDAEHPMPVMEIHGTADDVVSYDGTVFFESTPNVVSYWTGFNNCDTNAIVTEIPDIDPEDGSTVEHQLYPGGDNGVVVEHYKIIDGGHTWPGNFLGGAGTNNDIDASAEVWAFFSKYDINGLISPVAVEALIEVSPVVNIYPNPVRDFLFIESNEALPVHYELYNPMGKLLFSGKMFLSKLKLDLTGVLSGIYIFRIGNKNFKVLKTD